MVCVRKNRRYANNKFGLLHCIIIRFSRSYLSDKKSDTKKMKVYNKFTFTNCLMKLQTLAVCQMCD